MLSGIDHVVHAVMDLDVAADAYAELGFTVTPRADHPWGTANRLVQMEGSYVELLAVVDPAKLTAAPPRGFGFGAFNRDFLVDGPGLSMIALATDDAAGVNERFTAAGIGGYDHLDFSRHADQADGSRATVSFSLAFARSPFPNLGLFACQQHAPDLVWQPEYMRHANGATHLAEVTVVDGEDRAASEFLMKALQLNPQQRDRDDRFVWSSAAIVVTTAAGAPYRCGPLAPIHASRLPAISGLVFRSPEGERTAATMIEGALVAV